MSKNDKIKILITKPEIEIAFGRQITQTDCNSKNGVSFAQKKS